MRWVTYVTRTTTTLLKVKAGTVSMKRKCEEKKSFFFKTMLLNKNALQNEQKSEQKK